MVPTLSNQTLEVTFILIVTLAFSTPRKGRFTPRAEGIIDFGVMYAPKTARSFNGSRRVLFGWVMESWCSEGCRYGPVCGWDSTPPVSWDGAAALPRELTVDQATGHLLMDPVAEVATLRVPGSKRSLGPWPLSPTDPAIAVMRGRGVELNITAHAPTPGTSLVVNVLCSSPPPHPGECTSIVVNGTSRKVVVDLSRSTIGSVGSRAPVMAPIPDAPGPLKMSVFVDYSIVEVFVSSRSVLTARVYPTLSNSDGVFVGAAGVADVNVTQLEAWELAR